MIDVGEADVLVGVPTYNNAATVGQVVQTIRAGLLKYFPRERAVIVNADGGSRDETSNLVRGASINDLQHSTDLNALRTLKTFKGTVLSCVLNDTLVSSTADGSVLTPGNGFYYLGRGGTCNVNPYHWNDAVPTPASQSVNRNGQIQSDPISCP